MTRWFYTSCTHRQCALTHCMLLEVLDIFILCLATQMSAAVTKILLVSLYSLQPSHRARHAHSRRRPFPPHLPSTVGFSSLIFISTLCSLLLAYTQLLVPANLPIMLLPFFPLACARQHHPIIPPLTTAQPYERKL